MTHDIQTAIQRRIDHNRVHGVGFIEGQTLPHSITLETACTLAEYWTRGMNDEAIALIATLPQAEIIRRIYCACAGIGK
ncbi:hypothetical protein H6F53_23110 [Trichocoleus sp. FACHB-832]|uniref:hypothetical protein n=1 Tax=Trichocoleus sp. FACHB-832 TaxID=2692875 RepID=UPI001684DEB0|nr:hypothetical protein [Trichocoleus sp. FACHB-832]MBD1908338.1 hypothetical protein [Trichocoleus sp. FACHB-832]